jgi:hypothetical protein
MPSPQNFKTASWRGIIRPDLHPPNELVTLSVRLPRDLADDVALAADGYCRHFDSDEELIATAVGFAINSLAEEPPPIRIPKGTEKRRKPHSARRRHSTVHLW